MTLDAFFRPTSIAIIGASREPKKVGHLVAKNLIDQGYKGNIYLVNPKGGRILDRKVYASLDEIGAPVDLAILAVPAPIAMNCLADLNRLGIKNAVMYAAGFKETGKEGAAMEQKLAEACRAFGITLLGPNCIGFINTDKAINVTFLKHTCPKGNIGFVSQSGALGSVMLDYFAAHEKIGFSYFVSMGNKTVIDESDALEFLAADDRTDVIGMYLEDIRDGARFRSVLSRVTKQKPVVILKSGSTKEGSTAALSHTGGLVGDDGVYDAAFRQHGAIRASTYTEFMTILKLLSFKKVPASGSTLVLSNAGGVGVLLADQLIANGLSLTTISEKTKKSIEEAFGPTKKVSLHNPIDVLGDASAFDYQLAIDRTIKEKNIGSIIILLTPQANTQISETAKIVAKTQAHFDKPVYPVFMGEESLAGTYRFFDAQRIPSFSSYDYLPPAIAKIVRWQEYRNRQEESPAAGPLSKLSLLASEREIGDILAKAGHRPFLNVSDSLEVLRLSGVPVIGSALISSASELIPAASRLGYPLVAKVSSNVITHKTEVKGVITGIGSSEELSSAYARLTAIDKSGSVKVMLQQMAGGYELLIGAKRDPTFGIILVVGMGGIYTELLKDVSYRIFPFTAGDFADMLSQTRVSKLIGGYRGAPPLDQKALYHMVSAVGQLMKRFSVIQEIDINPVMTAGGSGVAVDGRIILQT